jgi:Amt family ammonium transporter
LLAGLVSITANCHLVSTPAAVCIGAIGGGISSIVTNQLVRLKIDDAIGAVPVHASAGVWGTLAVAIFGDVSTFADQSRWSQFIVQLTGAGAIFAWSFGAGLVVLLVINRFISLRVSPEAERLGLNVSEHNTSYELLDLLVEMESQRQTGDFSQPTSIASHTEVGEIAAQYNRVLQTVQTERQQLLDANKSVLEANSKMAQMRDELQDKVAELEEFNRAAVGRELRMIELKRDINALSEGLGLAEPYDLAFDDEFLVSTGADGGNDAIV